MYPPRYRPRFSGPPGKLFVDPLNGSDTLGDGSSWGRALAGSTATLAAAIKPGMTVYQRPGTTLRAAYPSCRGVTYIGNGATVYGSEKILGSDAGWTLDSGTRYKIATALHAPVCGGIPSVFLVIAGSSTALTRQSTNTPGSITANQWALTGGFFYVDLGRAPNSGDTFEIPQRGFVSVEADGMRVLGFTVRYWELYAVAANLTNDYSGLEVGNCDFGSGISDAININLGRGRNNWFHDNYFHDLPADGGGMADGISAHQNGAGSGAGASGIIERCFFKKCDKSGISNDMDGTWVYRDLGFDAAPFFLNGVGTTAGSHIIRRVGMVNEWTGAAADAQFFLVFPSGPSATVIDIVGFTIARGAGSTTLRGLRIQSGTLTRAADIMIWGKGNDGTSRIGFALLGGGTLAASSGVAVGGCAADTGGGWTTAADVSLSVDPTASMAGTNSALADVATNLAPAVGAAGNPIRTTGTVIAGITTNPAAIGMTAVAA